MNGEEIAFIIYIIGIFVTYIINIVITRYLYIHKGGDGELNMGNVLIIMLWPLVLVCLIILCPAWLIMKLNSLIENCFIKKPKIKKEKK